MSDEHITDTLEELLELLYDENCTLVTDMKSIYLYFNDYDELIDLEIANRSSNETLH